MGILIWVVGYEAEGHVAAAVDFDDVAAYGRRGGVDGFPAVDAGVGGGTLDDLEVVAVDVERVAAAVEVVDDDFDDVVVLEELGVCGFSVDDGVRGGFSDAEGGVEGGDFWFDVGLVVDCESDIRGFSEEMWERDWGWAWLPVLVVYYAGVHIQYDLAGDGLEQG